MASASDDFNRADGSLGANWTVTEGNGGAISGNKVVGNDGGFGASRYNAVSFSADQSSQITKVDPDNYVAPAVRMSATRNFYGFYDHGVIIRCVNGSTTELGSFPTYTTGDVAKITASGSTLEAFINGGSQGTHNDTTLATGQPGFASFGTAGAWDDWSAADLAAGSLPWLYRPHTHTIGAGFAGSAA